ncbi:MAG: mechanosensitive ion channel family protein [Erythrobacter sp.]|nr:mechanosensitive ion channel family protein [Erythrobacter sp.]
MAGTIPASGGEESRDQAVRLLNDFQDISFVQIALIVAGTWAAIKLVRWILPLLAERGPSQTRLWLLGAVPIVRLLLMTGAVLWIVPIVFNITFQNFLVIAGAASVAIGFAFKDYVSSLIAGIVALVEKPYRAGDWVQIDDDYGEVRSVGLRAIKIVTADDNAISVPHARIWTDNISNANDGAHTLQCVADFFLAPQHDTEAIRAALTDVALTSPYLDYGLPIVVVAKEASFATHYKVRLYPFDLRDQFLIVTDITARGKRAIAAAGGTLVTARPAVEADGAPIVGG